MGQTEIVLVMTLVAVVVVVIAGIFSSSVERMGSCQPPEHRSPSRYVSSTHQASSVVYEQKDGTGRTIARWSAP